MAKQDDYPFTETDKLVSRLAAGLSRLSLQDRIDAVLCACTGDEMEAIAAYISNYAKCDRKPATEEHRRRVRELIPRIVAMQWIIHGKKEPETLGTFKLSDYLPEKEPAQ